MKSKNLMLTATLASILAMGTVVATNSALAVPDQPKSWEKYVGIAKAGVNDCGALDGIHECSSQATRANNNNE